MPYEALTQHEWQILSTEDDQNQHLLDLAQPIHDLAQPIDGLETQTPALTRALALHLPQPPATAAE